jgi:hypothetical protein
MAEELNPEIDNQADTSGLSLDNPDKQENSDHEKKTVKKADTDNGVNNNDVNDSAPETYDFKDVKLPDGMELDAELTGEFSSIAKEMKLSQAKADKFMGMGVKLSQKLQQNFENAIKEAQGNRIKEIKTMLNTDPEIGGANLKSTLLEANEAYKAFVSEEAANVLAETGLNNHPAIVKMFRDIGRQVKGDTIKGLGSPKHQRTAEDWYPSMKKQN